MAGLEAVASRLLSRDLLGWRLVEGAVAERGEHTLDRRRARAMSAWLWRSPWVSLWS